MDEPTATLPAIPGKRGLFPLGHRPRAVLLVIILLLLLLAAALYLWREAPPEAARLLPESDAIVYLDLAPIRAAANFDAHPVEHDPDYQHFIDATGIQFEHDLDQAAFALHRMDNPLGPNGPVAYSSVFVGKFDRTRLASYLETIAQSKEDYAGRTIYDIPIEGRTDRVAILSPTIVAVSNAPTTEQIHAILDRRRNAYLPFSGNSLLSQRYGEVPALASAWGIGKLAIGLGSDFKLFGFALPLSTDATFIASARWAGSLDLRIEEIAPNATAATLSADSLISLLNLAKTAENMLPNAIANPDTKALLNSVAIDHHNDRATVTASIPTELIRQLSQSSKAK